MACRRVSALFCCSCKFCSFSTEWLRADPRRTAVGLDLDREALEWGAEHNLSQLANSAFGRVYLLQGNVLENLSNGQPVLPLHVGIRQMGVSCGVGGEGQGFVNSRGEVLMAANEDTSSFPSGDCKLQPRSSLSNVAMRNGGTGMQESSARKQSTAAVSAMSEGSGSDTEARSCESGSDSNTAFTKQQLCRKADIICAFNFSACCLQSRADLLKYLKGVVQRLRGSSSAPDGQKQQQQHYSRGRQRLEGSKKTEDTASIAKVAEIITAPDNGRRGQEDNVGDVDKGNDAIACTSSEGELDDSISVGSLMREREVCSPWIFMGAPRQNAQ